MTFEKACKILNTHPSRIDTHGKDYLRDYAASRFDTFTTSAPLRMKVAAITIIRYCDNI